MLRMAALALAIGLVTTTDSPQGHLVLSRAPQVGGRSGGPVLSKFTVFVKNHNLLPDAIMSLNQTTAQVGEWLYVPGSIASAEMKGTLLGLVAIPVSAASAPKKPLLNVSATYTYTGPDGASNFVEIALLVHSDASGKAVASVEFAMFFLPSNLTATADDFEVMVNGNGEFTYVATLAQPGGRGPGAVSRSR
jgi:hypothetical protein